MRLAPARPRLRARPVLQCLLPDRSPNCKADETRHAGLLPQPVLELGVAGSTAETDARRPPRDRRFGFARSPVHNPRAGPGLRPSRSRARHQPPATQRAREESSPAASAMVPSFFTINTVGIG